MTDHRDTENRSIALHAAVAERARVNAAIVARARERVGDWRRRGTVAAFYVDAWDELLRLDIDALCAALVDGGERACALRQVTPFAGALSPRERWAILRNTRA